MEIAIHKVLNVGHSFEYTYDFGTSTDLTGRVLSVRQGVANQAIQILARNQQPDIKCVHCGKAAKQQR